ncbi:MAG: hypothetical protein JSW26_13465 [Desulfobacterales bacterium]|nr:MAG: hypothetical protein JSW26_13465 [Desulfobacterales bacterium]
MKKTLLFLFVFVISFVFISPIHAYVLQGRHVLDLMIQELGVAETLFVSQRLIFYRMAASADTSTSATGEAPQTTPGTGDNAFPAATDPKTNQKDLLSETIELEESLRYVFSRAFRSDARSQNSERIYIFSRGRTLTIIDGNIVPDAANRFDLYKDILLFRSREELADRLLELGVDVSISSLGRFEDKIAFVIGADYPDESVNQLWVDKDTLLPLRLIIKGVNGTADSGTAEVRYLTWWSIGETRYPSKIEFYQDDNLVRFSQARNFEENATFSEELFDIEHLKMVYPRTLALPIVPGAPEEPSEVQKTIEEFKRIFE